MLRRSLRAPIPIMVLIAVHVAYRFGDMVSIVADGELLEVSTPSSEASVITRSCRSLPR